jgi:hypothetical protein
VTNVEKEILKLMTDERKDTSPSYNFIHGLYLSFFSKSFYRQIARKWKGFGFSYLLFILCLLWIPEIMRIQSDVADYLKEEGPKYVNQIPEITIAGGKVSIKEPVPYFINVPEKDIPFAIIDTSGQIASLEKTGAVILLTDSQLIVKDGSSKSRVFSLEGTDVIIDQKMIREWMNSFIRLFPFVLFPLVLLFSLLFHIVQVLMAAWVGSFIAKKFETELSYKTLVRLASVAFTPAIMLQAFHALLDIQFPYRGPIAFLITIGYLYYGVGSNSEPELMGNSRPL